MRLTTKLAGAQSLQPALLLNPLGRHRGLARLAALFPAYEQRWFELRQSWEAEAKAKKKKPRNKK